MSVLVIVLIVIAALAVLFFVGGLIYSRRRLQRSDYAGHVARADQALEAARAEDRGWDRVVMEEAAREALARERPDWRYDELHLVLVDDRPGMTEDTAQFLAIARDGEARVVLVRHEAGWRGDSVV
jgi:hypothetical protein